MKKALSIFLAIVMTLSLCVTAYAADAGMQNFVNKNTYANNFTDVPSTHWAAPSVAACYELGIMYGSSDTGFSPSNNLTVAEALVMASRVHSIYNTGETVVFSGGDPWYQLYVSYAVQNGIIKEFDFMDYNAKITRAQMAYIFYNALPSKEFNTISSVPEIPDVPMFHKYFAPIKGLYDAGILTGSDDKGSFFPDNNITRAEAAAIISRVAKSDLRVKFSLAKTGTALNAEQIADRCSDAVAYVEIYISNKLYASGSGFFIDAAGTFVTNFHVIEDAESIKVTTTNGRTYNVSGVYDVDPARDIALLKVDGSGFDYIETDMSAPKMGQTIYAIGSPQGLSNSISSGIISNVSREVYGLDFMQFTAPISSGSSGGALINEYGKVIGITSASYDDGSSSSQNLNLAIPISYIGTLSKNSVTPLSDIKNILFDHLSLSVSVKSLEIGTSGVTPITVTFSPGASNYAYAYIVDTDESVVNGFWLTSDESDCEYTFYCVGLSSGIALISFGFKYDEDTSVTKSIVSVAVTGNPPTTKPYGTYKCGAPLYQSVTSAECLRSFNSNTLNYYPGYVTYADTFLYDYDKDQVVLYLEAMIRSGWTARLASVSPEGIVYIFSKGNQSLGIVVYTDVGVAITVS